jgi:hypothetical protein
MTNIYVGNLDFAKNSLVGCIGFDSTIGSSKVADLQHRALEIGACLIWRNIPVTLRTRPRFTTSETLKPRPRRTDGASW